MADRGLVGTGRPRVLTRLSNAIDRLFIGLNGNYQKPLRRPRPNRVVR